MPISGVQSYLPTMQIFIDHWTAANTALGAPVNAIKLQGNYTLANFTTDRATIQAKVDLIVAADNDRTTAAGNRDTIKAGIHPRIPQFNHLVKSLLSNTGYPRSLPKQPSFTDAESRFVNPFVDMLNLWTTINADPILFSPLKLAGGYSVTDFSLEVDNLKAAYLAARQTADADSVARGNRDMLLPAAKQRMKQYRQAVLGRFAAGDAIVLSLPALTPPPGSTPDPVNASGLWNPATSKADLSWSASANPNLDHYSVRTAPGPSYKAKDEEVVAEVVKTSTAYSTNEGLIPAGSRSLFRIYVVLTTMNERGSNTVSVVHPV